MQRLKDIFTRPPKEAAQPFKEAWSQEGKMDTGFKWGEELRTEDYEFAQRRDVISHALTMRIAQTLFRNGLVVEKVKRRRDLPGDIDDTRTDEVNDLAEEYQIPLRGPEAVHYERVYGYSVVPILREGDEAWIEPKSERMINQSFFNEKGEFTEIEIGRLYGNQWTYVWIEPQNFVHLRTRPREDLPYHQGVSVLETVWDPAETLRKVVWGAGQRFYRMAFTHMKIAGSTPEQQAEVEAKFGNLTPRTLAVTNEHVEIDMPSIGGAALSPIEYMDTMLYMITIDTGIPIDILRGDAEATVAGGAISNASYFEYLLMQQKPLLPFLSELFRKLGYTLPDDRQIRFDLQYEMDPKDASLVKLNETENLARSDWLSPNEKRGLDPRGIPKKPGEQEDELYAIMQLMKPDPFAGNGTPPDTTTSTTSEGKQAPRPPGKDAALVLGALPDEQKAGIVGLIDSYRADGTSLKKSLARMKTQHGFKIHERTYYKWKAIYDG